MRCNIVSIACVAVLCSVTLAHANVVLYDGTLGDADPVSQGASSNIASATDTTPITGSFITPDAANDFVRVERGSNETLNVGHNFNSCAGAVVRPLMADDSFAWEIDIATGPDNTLMHLDVISGAAYNSGWRDRAFIEEDQVRLVGGLTPLAPFTSTTVAVGANGSPWTSMQNRNTFRFERVGFGFKMFANGTLVFNGFGAASGISSTQVNVTEERASGESQYFNLVYGEIPEPPLSGDMDGDGNITTADVPLFVQALLDRAAYDTAFPGINADLIGDVDLSGTFDFGDIAAFNDLFAGLASASAVPEPNSMILFGIALCAVVLRQRCFFHSSCGLGWLESRPQDVA